MKINNIIIPIFCTIICFFIAGCQQRQSVIINNTVCHFPCWQNIYPGKTTSEEAKIILQELSILATKPADSPIQIDKVLSYDSFNFVNTVSEEGAYIFFRNDIVAYIIFFTHKNTTIGDMVNYYGTPEYVSITSGWQDSRWLNVSIIYPSQGVVINHYDDSWKPKDNKARVTQNLSVFKVYYFDPNLYDLLIDTEFLNITNIDIIHKSIQPWTGYGYFPFFEE